MVPNSTPSPISGAFKSVTFIKPTLIIEYTYLNYNYFVPTVLAYLSIPNFFAEIKDLIFTIPEIGILYLLHNNYGSYH